MSIFDKGTAPVITGTIIGSSAIPGSGAMNKIRQATDEPQREISNAVRIMQESTARLFELLNVLEQKIEPILTPLSGQNGEGSQAPSPTRSKVAEVLYDHGNSIEHAGDRVQNLINRIEL